MAKVEDFYLGSTHVEIWDDYVVKTQEEVDAILNNISIIWTQHLARKRAEAKAIAELEGNGNTESPLDDVK